MMKIKDKLFIITLFLVIFLSLSNVGAVELTDTDLNTGDTGDLSVSDDNSIGQTVNYGENLEMDDNIINETEDKAILMDNSNDVLSEDSDSKDKANLTIEINAENINYGETANIKINLSQSIDDEVIINVDNIDYRVNISRGSGELKLANLDPGNYTVTAVFGGNDDYNIATKVTNFKVNKLDISLDLTVNDINYGETAEIQIMLNESIEDRVIINIDGKNYLVNITRGSGDLKLEKLDSGIYTVTATFEGNKYYNSISEVRVFSVNKLNVSLEVSADDIDYGEIAIIQVKLNESIDGEVNINVDGNTYVVNINRGYGTLEVKKLDSGNYTVTATFKGNVYYDNITNTTTFTVNKLNLSLEVSAEDIDYKETEIIKITLNEILNDKVILNINDEKYEVNITNGIGELKLEDLEPGYYSVSATFGGNGYYNNLTNTTNFTVNKLNTGLELIAEDIDYRETATIQIKLNETINGTVNLNVDDNTYVVTITDGTGQQEIKNLVPGNYSVSATFGGNNYYNTITNTTSFTVDKLDMILELTAEDIDYKETETIQVKLSEVINTNVTISINGKEEIISLINGEGKLELNNLTAGNYTVEATFDGNDICHSVSNTTDFTVNKIDTEVNINITDINKTNKLVVVNVESDATGTISILLEDGTSLGSYELVNGKAEADIYIYPGNYSLNIVYSGDNNYNNNSKVVDVEFEKLETEINVTIPITNKTNKLVVVNVESDATGTIDILLEDGTSLGSYELVNGEIKADIHLKPGNYSLNIVYSGDNKYYNNSKVVDVEFEKLITDLTVETDDINYGENATITINLIDKKGNGINDTVTLTIDETEYNVTLEDGNAILIVENLTVGEHTVTVAFNPEEIYEDAFAGAIITVNKATPKNNISLDVQTEDIIYGENATITVTFNGVNDDKINDTVILSINGEEYSVELTDNVGSINISNLEAEKYAVVATFAGNENYTKVVANTSFTVSPSSEAKLIINAANTSYGEDNLIEISLTGVNDEEITGIVNLTVNDITYSVAVIDGVGTLTVTDLKTGNYTISAEFLGNKNYTSTNVETDFQVSKDPTTNLTIIPIDINYGSDETISISLNGLKGGINGTVIIKIDNETYTVNTTNGIGVLTIPDLMPGNYTAEASYAGDDNYEGQNTSANFTVSKSNQAKIEISTTNIQYGENETINVSLTGNNQTPLNGTVDLNIKGTTYTVNITDGKGNLTLDKPDAETYNIIATFNGDDCYEATEISNSFTVSKFTNTTLIVTGTNINYGDDEKITIQVIGANNEGVNTIIKVTVNNETYKVATSNGQGTLSIKNLNAGNYTILAELEEDTNYDYVNATDKFTVSKNTNANIKINATKITYGENATINIELTGSNNEKLNGTVNLEIDNKTYTTNITDGKGTTTISNLSGGTHTILANYTGDENYESTTTTDTIDVEKLNTTLIFKNMTTKVVLNGARNGEWFNVTLKDINGNILANKSILIAFNGKVYNKTTDENGTAKLQINIGYQSANTFAITFLGDENYSGNVSCAIIVVNTLKTKLTAAKSTYTYKSSAKTKTVKATLKLSNGTVVSGQTVSIKINGATYQATTNSKGVATITIPITKKGTYSTTLTFAGNNQYTKSTASIKVKIS